MGLGLAKYGEPRTEYATRDFGTPKNNAKSISDGGEIQITWKSVEFLLR